MVDSTVFPAHPPLAYPFRPTRTAAGLPLPLETVLNPSKMSSYTRYAANPPRMNTYKIAICKPSGMNTYTKGGRGKALIMLRIEGRQQSRSGGESSGSLDRRDDGILSRRGAYLRERSLMQVTRTR